MKKAHLQACGALGRTLGFILSLPVACWTVGHSSREAPRGRPSGAASHLHLFDQPAFRSSASFPR